MALWHVREQLLGPGDLIQPGRWGAEIQRVGQHHQFFAREEILERHRLTATSIQVSRLQCCFAFEDRAFAAGWAREDSSSLYRVESQESGAALLRLDMLWLTWMGEPGSTAEINRARCGYYWEGRSTQELKPDASPTWEYLIDGGLRIVAREDP